MKRRKFIVLSAINAAAISVPLLQCESSNPELDLDKVLSVPGMLSHFCDAKTLQEIGKAYGTKMPDDYSAKKIEQLLMSDMQGNTISETTAPANIHAFMEKNIHNDFASDKTIILNGWVLSMTEARQCALFSLFPQGK